MAKQHDKVLVAMSGGVDSSVAALVLRDAGFDVTGMTLRLFDNDGFAAEGEASCSSLKDAEDARQVCFDLGIPHFVYNYTAAFASDVVDRFCQGYLSGATPNPCIDCNRYVKFAALQKCQRKLDFDYVATGHYALRRFNDATARHELARGTDAGKDQSYVLFHLEQELLAHLLFPLGDMTKPEVRALAEQHGFVNAHKGESQDICFIPDGDYATFIEKRTGCTFDPGDIVDCDGKVLGRHRGLARYTIGQRKGIGVAAGEPLYVFAKDLVRNELVVDTDARTLCREIEVADVNFIARAEITAPEQLAVKTHYRQQARPAVVEQTGKTGIRIRFDVPQRACAPGQAAVVYDGDTVVCGGTITSSR